jgi:hypothetical protein
MNHRLIADLALDGDDFAMTIVPELNWRLGIAPKVDAWETVVTVRMLLTWLRATLAACSQSLLIRLPGA